MVTLEQRYASRAQNGEFVVVFDALGEDGNIKRMRNADYAGHDHLLGAALIDIAQQLHVDLDQVRLKPRQQTQTGISRAEIIQRRPEAQLAIYLDDPLYIFSFSVNSNIRFRWGNPTRLAAASDF